MAPEKNEDGMSRSSTASWMDAVEMAAALALTAFLAGLQVLFFLRGGGLFQDEVATVNIAQLPSVLDVWEHLQFDSMPLVWPYVLRAWAALGFTSDLALRFPGLVLGLLVLAALWILAPQFGCRTPLIALAFVELNFEGTRTVGYIKQYGLGILLNLGFLASVWSCVKSPSRWRWWLALLVGMLGAHTLYHNCFFILATLAAGMAVTLSERAWKRTLGLLAMGLTILVSMTIYTATLTTVADWSPTVELPAHYRTWSNFFQGLLRSLSPTGTFWLWFWAAAAVFCVLCWASRRRGEETAPATKDRPRIVFLLAAILAAVVYLGFFAVSRQPYNSRYFIVLFAYVAVPAEALLLIRVNAFAIMRLLRLAMVAYLCWAYAGPVWRDIARGESQMVRVVELIEANADNGDLIVISPWAEGMIFARYFHGPNPWFTIPPLEDNRMHRSDLIKKCMQEDDPTAAARAKIAEALQDKRRVFFVVGNAMISQQATIPVRPGKPPLPLTEWNETVYLLYWHAGTQTLLLRHSVEQEFLCRASGEYRSPVGLICFQGWK